MTTFNLFDSNLYSRQTQPKKVTFTCNNGSATLYSPVLVDIELEQTPMPKLRLDSLIIRQWLDNNDDTILFLTNVFDYNRDVAQGGRKAIIKLLHIKVEIEPIKGFTIEAEGVFYIVKSQYVQHHALRIGEIVFERLHPRE